jgi:hypothetical protein
MRWVRLVTLHTLRYPPARQSATAAHECGLQINLRELRACFPTDEDTFTLSVVLAALKPIFVCFGGT